MLDRLKNPKLWAMTITATLAILNETVGLHIPDEAVWIIAGVVGMWVFGEPIKKAVTK